MDNLTYDLITMKALPAYELFCELSSAIGENFLSLSINDNINIHILVAQKCSNASKAKEAMRRLFNATFKNIYIDGNLYLQDDMSLALWSKMINIAIKHQFSDFFLDLRKSLSDLNEMH